MRTSVIVIVFAICVCILYLIFGPQEQIIIGMSDKKIESFPKESVSPHKQQERGDSVPAPTFAQLQQREPAAPPTLAHLQQREPAALPPLAQLRQREPVALSPTGDLAEMFTLFSENTDLQRQLKLKEILGKVVEWQLPVYEVRQEGNTYLIQTSPTLKGDNLREKHVGVFIHITPQDESDRRFIENLKTGHLIKFKGVIEGATMRNLDIKPAILVMEANAVTSTGQPQQLTSRAARTTNQEQSDVIGRDQAVSFLENVFKSDERLSGQDSDIAAKFINCITNNIVDDVFPNGVKEIDRKAFERRVAIAVDSENPAVKLKIAKCLISSGILQGAIIQGLEKSN